MPSCGCDTLSVILCIIRDDARESTSCRAPASASGVVPSSAAACMFAPALSSAAARFGRSTYRYD